MKLRTKWTKRILATLLSASLVLVNDSVLSVALTVTDGEETITEPDNERWQHYEEPGESEGDPTRIFDLFDGSKANESLSVELTNDDVHNAGEEGDEGWYPTEDKNYIFVNDTDVSVDLSGGIDVGFFRDTTVEITDTSDSGIEPEGDGCDPSLLHPDGDDEGDRIIEEIVADGDLLEEMRTTAVNPYDAFWGTEDCPIIVEVALVGYERPGDAAFPVSIGSVSGENMIDGWDRMKARVSAGSITLSWPAESKPTQICIEDGDDDYTSGGWEIRDIEDGVTSVSVKVGSGDRDFYCIEAKYGNYGPGPEDNHAIGVDFHYDISLIPEDDNSTFSFDVSGRRSNNVSFGLDGGHYGFAKSSVDTHKELNFSVSDDTSGLGFRLQTAGKKVVNASYIIGEDEHPLTDEQINALTSEGGGFIIPVREGEDWIDLILFSVTLDNDDQGGGGGNTHTIGVDFLPDLSSLPGDDDANLSIEVEGRQSDNGRINLAGGHYDFSKSNDSEHLINVSVPENSTNLGLRLQTAGKKVVSASYVIGEETHPLSNDDINALTSPEGCFQIPVFDGENWVEVIVFSVKLENDDQGGGGGQGGGGNDITYSENTTISEDTTKNDVKVENAILTIGNNCSLRIDHRLDVEGTGTIVGTSNTSKLVFPKGSFSYGLDLYCNDEKISGGPTNSFDNPSDGPSEFTWDAVSSRWVTDHNPSGGGDAPWYTVSYGNSANLSIENGEVYAERVHVGDITYTMIESEYNASDTDEIYSMADTIFHKKKEGVEGEDWDPMPIYGIGGSDGDIMIRSDVSGVTIDFKFVPDYGYQLKNIYTNENEQDTLMSKFNAQETVSSFKFDVKKGDNVHFIVRFIEANNTVTGNAGLSSAKIESSNAAESGTLEMKIDSGTQSTNIPQGSEALAAYDITLKNIVSKGEGRGNWETSMTDLGANQATVTLPVEDTTNYTYSVIREHNGTETTLDASVTAGGISFETNQFSTYTIVKKPVAKSIATAEVTLGDALTYNGNSQTQTVSSVKLGETTLNASTDYEITNASKTEAGTYTLTVTGKGDYKESVTKQFTIAKASLTPSLTGTLTKDYDGLVTVSDASSLTISLADKFGSDDVNASAEKYEFADAAVDTGKTITASGITISGSKAANYELSATTVSAAVGTISKVTPTLTLTNLSETTQGARGASAIVMPGDVTANVKIEYYVVKKAAVAAQAEIPCTVEHDASCASLEVGKTLADCNCEKAHTIHTAECGYKAAVEAQAAEYEWTETRPSAPGTYDVRASLPVGTTNLNAVTTYVTGSYRLTQYVAPSSDDDDDDDSQNTEEPKTEVSTAETVATPASAPIVRTAPNITAVEPTIEAAKENLTVPSENIEAEVPEGISEEAKENLVEQVAETVSELVEAILAGDEAVENAVSEETLENIKVALDEGKTIIAVVKAEVVDESSIPSEDKSFIEEVISKEAENNIEVACYFDLSIMLKTTDGDELGTYNELTGMVTFTIEAPKDMPCPEGKEYVVIRIHNGESTILPVTVNADGTLSFETNEFSTYALAFMDKREVAVTSVVKEELQKSSDTTDKGTVITPSVQEETVKDKPKGWLWAVLGLIVIVGGAAVFFALRKKDE